MCVNNGHITTVNNGHITTVNNGYIKTVNNIIEVVTKARWGSHRMVVGFTTTCAISAYHCIALSTWILILEMFSDLIVSELVSCVLSVPLNDGM